MIGRGELRGAGGGGDVKSILNTCFFISSAFKGIFVLKRSLKKKTKPKKEWSSTKQASNETVAKNF